MFNLQGIYAPIPSVFQNDELALGKLADNMTFWLESKLSGIVVLGSNGEFIVLSPEEKRKSISAVCKLSKGRKPVIAGTGCESTKETIESTKYAAQAGAAAALVLSPNYYKRAMTDELNKKFYIEVADESPIPIILYNMPGNSGINLSSKLVAELAKHPNIIGIKDSGGNIVQIAEIINATSSEFAVFAGSASFLYPSLALGAAGGTLALANVLPNECAEIHELVLAGKHHQAKGLQLRLLDINQAVTTRWGVAGLKAALEMQGLYGGELRRPLLSLGEQERKELAVILEKAKNLVSA
ncbi:dihydrodipicolinate synthase family protein [Desulfosporosinus shakirovi]|uniref:dihydrodipicolinate synthase family protein n=1 Tax=Desulfosporosinus shakirovi TaxID=2885154 RepID=UPI001E390AB2|nr:dihydrodipicolinate synthase family protein [Desulfosporosinus sp. SRJS8]MCB8815142.1 dihydrodipicolinate synthase family protein [Desulfosporosinus sp. SRJS8]